MAPSVYGFRRPTRDYVHVDDVVRALLAAHGRPGVFNIATGVETEVMEVFSVLREAAGSSADPDLAPLRPGELERSCLDPARARGELGWEAAIPLREGLVRTYHALVEGFAAEERAERAGNARAP